MKLGIVADEIDRDFSKTLRTGGGLGLRRYEIRFLTTGRAPMCEHRELLEVERMAKEEGVELTALSPGSFKYVSDRASFKRDVTEIYPRAEWVHRWKASGPHCVRIPETRRHEENGDTISSRNPPAEVLGRFSQACLHARADVLTRMIEPEPICWADSASAAAELIRRIGAQAKINYDPGNVAWMQRRDPIGEFDTAAPFIANVHIKDVRPAVPGSGKPLFCRPARV